MSATIRSELFLAAASRRLVKLERPFRRESWLNGYVLAASDRLALVQVFHDFCHDGWVVTRVEDITEVVRDEKEAFFEAIFRGEGLLPRELPFTVDLSSMPAAIRSVHAAHRPIIVESENLDDDEEDDFWLGMIAEIDDLRVHVRFLSILGHWDDVDAMPLRRITKLQLETPYLLTFMKYADPPPTDE